MKKCISPICDRKQEHKRFLFCSVCWNKISEFHRSEIRKSTEKGSHTLRAKPNSEWLAKAYKYTSIK